MFENEKIETRVGIFAIITIQLEAREQERARTEIRCDAFSENDVRGTLIN